MATEPNRRPLIPARQARNRLRRKESRIHLGVYGFFFLVTALAVVYFLILAV